jgi:hypothetical protein
VRCSTSGRFTPDALDADQFSPSAATGTGVRPDAALRTEAVSTACIRKDHDWLLLRLDRIAIGQRLHRQLDSGSFVCLENLHANDWPSVSSR